MQVLKNVGAICENQKHGFKANCVRVKTLTKVTLKAVVETKFVLILYIQNEKPGSTKHSQRYQKAPCC